MRGATNTPLVRWHCWRCRYYLGRRAPEAKTSAPVLVRCPSCGASNPLHR